MNDIEVTKAKNILKEAAASQLKVLSVAAEIAIKKIASSADDAAKLIATSAAESSRILNAKNSDGANDHDLLVELKTKIFSMDKSIQALSDSLNVKMGDHETRLRTIETKLERLDTKMNVGGAVIVFLATAIQFIISHYWK